MEIPKGFLKKRHTIKMAFLYIQHVLSIFHLTLSIFHLHCQHIYIFMCLKTLLIQMQLVLWFVVAVNSCWYENCSNLLHSQHYCCRLPACLLVRLLFNVLFIIRWIGWTICSINKLQNIFRFRMKAWYDFKVSRNSW